MVMLSRSCQVFFSNFLCSSNSVSKKFIHSVSDSIAEPSTLALFFFSISVFLSVFIASLYFSFFTMSWHFDAFT